MLEEYLEGIVEVIEYVKKMGIIVNIYLEDWLNGMWNSFFYVF